MSAVTWLDASSELTGLPWPDDWPVLTASDIARQQPDASVVLRRGPGAVARASVWWRRGPAAGVGLIGHYGAIDAAAGNAVLEAACAALSARGCSHAIGPVDGSTWERYRLALPGFDAPPFLLEPVQPTSWSAHFVQAGFADVGRYRSDRAPLEVLASRARQDVERRLTSQGVTITTFADHPPEHVIDAIHAVSLEAFASAPWFTPIDAATLQAQYASAIPLADPAFVQLAWLHNAPAGFVFAVPDLLDARRTGQRPTALVLKSVAVRPAVPALAGLGGLLLARVATNALARGMHDGIHALMRDDNASALAFGGDRATTIRRYALYGRRLP
ncbi:MAG: hypothetical protein SFW08_05700 [Gemmatimonadaceae bacterium]|nr:hypothetical protein [Gemmatimonadaceae bacterium]